MNENYARELLQKAGVFFDAFDNGDEEDLELAQTINLNDAMYWGCSDCEFVPDDKLIEVAKLFLNYGDAGVFYWVSKQRDWERASFLDVNRKIDFVKAEEELIERIPSASTRIYEKIVYTLGDK